MRAGTWIVVLLLLAGCESQSEPITAELEPSSPEDNAGSVGGQEPSQHPSIPALPLQLPQRPPGIPAPPDVSAPPADAQRTASGLASKVLEPATGREHPGPRDGVTVHYTGWRAENGEMFDSSVQRGEPATFTLDHVIPGWTEGVQLMRVGEKRRLWIPGNLAYDGRPNRPQGMLVFDVELLRIYPLDAPSNVARPPRSARRTSSGLASLVLTPGTGTQHPAPTDVVQVHYAGWRAENGELFDTSLSRGAPASFPLNRVIPGWTEGLQLMVEGEQRRFWIPANLAYEGRSGPQGMLVFDVHLIGIGGQP